MLGLTNQETDRLKRQFIIERQVTNLKVGHSRIMERPLLLNLPNIQPNNSIRNLLKTEKDIKRLKIRKILRHSDISHRRNIQNDFHHLHISINRY
jgi:hypothetical protein